MNELTPERRAHMARIGRIGGFERAARLDTRAAMEPVTRAAESRFVKEARERFPDASDEEIERRAAAARKAFYARLSLAGVKARARK